MEFVDGPPQPAQGWSKTCGYYLADGLLPVFTEAMRVLKEQGSGKKNDA
ncbi:hypothetical protein [Streptomyces albogriseolus]